MSDTMDYLKCETCGRPAHEKGWTHSTCRPNWPANPRPPLGPTTARIPDDLKEWYEMHQKDAYGYFIERIGRAESALAAMREDRDYWKQNAELSARSGPRAEDYVAMRAERDRAQDALREIALAAEDLPQSGIWQKRDRLIELARAALAPVSPSSQLRATPPEGVPK